jgi:hypothetical protein
MRHTIRCTLAVLALTVTGIGLATPAMAADTTSPGDSAWVAPTTVTVTTDATATVATPPVPGDSAW